LPDDTYIFESITGDADAIHSAQVERMAELLPGWEESPTAIEVLASRAHASNMVALVDFASDVLATIVSQVAQVAGVARNEPEPMAGTVTVETDGEQTYVLPAGATFVGALPDQSSVVVITTTDTTIPAGTMSVADVPVQATDDGQVAGIAVPQVLRPDQAYTWLEDVTLDDVTSYGSDGDTDEEYLDRGSRRLGNLADQLILPRDVESYVRDIDGVGRVLVLDQVDATNPAVPVFPVDRCVTVVITGPDGSAPSNGLLTLFDAALQARREVNFRFFVVAPTYVPVVLEVTVAAWADSLTTAGPATEAALLAWLHPSTFGGRAYGYGDGDWSNTTTVRVGEVVSVADTVEGVDYVPPNLVEIDGLNDDFDLDAPLAALPDPANTTVVVNVVEREP
jgi:hypothetical protein